MMLAAILYLFAPAFIANAAPIPLVSVPWIARRNAPMWEAGLGSHKTWVGFIGGGIAGMLTAALQYALRGVPPFASHTFPYLNLTDALLIGGLLGFGALSGDALKSFLKRRLGIRPGGALPVWDGIDHILGSLLFLAPIYVPPLYGIFVLLAIGPVLSLAANIFSYTIGWKETWY
jgi:CDP-2,3-bis-(O-geranylgeranyl)-sn-glycerol synthase